MSETMVEKVADRFMKCPACNGEGSFDAGVTESGQPGTEGYLAIIEVEECDVCEGLGEIPWAN